MIEIRKACVSYGSRQVLRDVDCKVGKGEFYGIIGPNGSGKSTLLKLISGAEKADSGTVILNGRAIEEYSRRGLARLMSVLEQEALPPVGFTVREILEMGRYPHQNWLGRERGSPEKLLRGIMEGLGLEELSERPVDRLSGGERQRVSLGRAMAQEPSLLLLDEPTTYLDIGYQLLMMDYVHGMNRKGGLTVVAVLHDLNLAAQYCDRIMVLKDGVPAAEGAPWEVLTPGLIEMVYGTKPLVVGHPVMGVPQVLLLPEGAAGKGIRPGSRDTGLS